MRIQIEVDEHLTEDEVIIRCRTLNDTISRIQKQISGIAAEAGKFQFTRGDTEYYIPLAEVLFFETEGTRVNVHTRDNIYQTRYKLYELEELLPAYFMRVSKSAILNVEQIYSITRNLTAASLVQFTDSHKQVFVSRSYFKPLQYKLEEKRIAK